MLSIERKGFSMNRLEKYSVERLEEMKAHCQDAIQRIDSMDAPSKVLDYARDLRVKSIERIDETIEFHQQSK